MPIPANFGTESPMGEKLGVGVARNVLQRLEYRGDIVGATPTELAVFGGGQAAGVFQPQSIPIAQTRFKPTPVSAAIFLITSVAYSVADNAIHHASNQRGRYAVAANGTMTLTLEPANVFVGTAGHAALTNVGNAFVFTVTGTAGRTLWNVSIDFDAQVSDVPATFGNTF